VTVPTRAAVVRPGAPAGCNGGVDEEQDANAEVSASVMDVVGPELARCSALADELAHLLLPARLFS
jgi:hypothetical protein